MSNEWLATCLLERRISNTSSPLHSFVYSASATSDFVQSLQDSTSTLSRNTWCEASQGLLESKGWEAQIILRLWITMTSTRCLRVVTPIPWYKSKTAIWIGQARIYGLLSTLRTDICNNESLLQSTTISSRLLRNVALCVFGRLCYASSSQCAEYVKPCNTLAR